MTDSDGVSHPNAEIKKITEEAREIQRRYSSSDNTAYRAQLEARYADLERKLRIIRRELPDPGTCQLSSSGAKREIAETGPFGIAMGASIEVFGSDLEELNRGKYRLNSVPKPHSAFESYIIQASPRYGVSWIKAIGRTIATNRYGTQLRIEFESMLSRLQKVYGTGNVLSDYLMPGSIWSEPEDWMMGLLKDERSLCANWDSKVGVDLPSGIRTIFLSASAQSKEDGYIVVEYYGFYSQACDEELASEEDDAL